jgi:hypothetical protein
MRWGGGSSSLLWWKVVVEVRKRKASAGKTSDLFGQGGLCRFAWPAVVCVYAVCLRHVVLTVHGDPKNSQQIGEAPTVKRCRIKI